MALDAGRFLHPLFARLVRWEAQRIVRRFHRSLADPRHTQLRVLLEKLRRNADSDFGRRCSIAAVRSIEDFRRAVPITTYADYEPFIDRVRHGDSGAMFGPGQKLHMFAMTSGTAGRPKYIPVTGHFLREYRRGWMTWGIQAFLDHSEAFESRILQLVSPMDDETAPCGLPCGAMSGLTAHVQRKGARNIYVIPPAVARLKNTAQKYYVALLLALRCPRLIILSANPSTLLGLARALDEDKESLLRDLRDSRVSDSLDLPPDIRREIQRRLRPASRRVAELERHVVADGALLPRAAWQIPFLGCWKGGTLSLYLREFPRYFGGAVVRDIGLIASEGRMTVPLGDEGSAGVLDLESNFFEFVPARDGRRADDRALLPHELEVGGEYFLLITNSAGLYRYDIGDVVAWSTGRATCPGWSSSTRAPTTPASPARNCPSTRWWRPLTVPWPTAARDSRPMRWPPSGPRTHPTTCSSPNRATWRPARPRASPPPWTPFSPASMSSTIPNVPADGSRP